MGRKRIKRIKRKRAGMPPSPLKRRFGARKIRKAKRGTLISRLDTVFSLFIRQKYAKNGLVACYTCPKILPIKKIQNGHYISRSVRRLRWDENNCRPQCWGCNCMNGGRPVDFRENLVKEIGEDEVKFLEASRHTIFKPDESWLLSQIQMYTSLLEKE